jgi:hypothetical protein
MKNLRVSIVSLALLLSICIPLVAVVGVGTLASAAAAPICSSKALSVTLGVKGHDAMSSAGFAVDVTNEGATTCALDGFATVTALTRTSSAKSITFVHSSQSQDYSTASPRTILLGPRGTASFGVSYTDNKDPQYGHATDCQMYALNVRLPVKPNRTTRISLTTIHSGPGENYVNSCFTNFKFGLTPLVTGLTPPQP